MLIGYHTHRSSPKCSPHFPAPFPPFHTDSFVKHISLTNQRVKISRQTTARTVPAENNGYFDSKVLSRQHAEVWEETGKVCIRNPGYLVGIERFGRSSSMASD
jgi:hypothetical protein